MNPGSAAQFYSSKSIPETPSLRLRTCNPQQQNGAMHRPAGDVQYRAVGHEANDEGGVCCARDSLTLRRAQTGQYRFLPKNGAEMRKGQFRAKFPSGAPPGLRAALRDPLVDLQQRRFRADVPDGAVERRHGKSQRCWPPVARASPHHPGAKTTPEKTITLESRPHT